MILSVHKLKTNSYLPLPKFDIIMAQTLDESPYSLKLESSIKRVIQKKSSDSGEIKTAVTLKQAARIWGLWQVWLWPFGVSSSHAILFKTENGYQRLF